MFTGTKFYKKTNFESKNNIYQSFSRIFCFFSIKSIKKMLKNPERKRKSFFLFKIWDSRKIWSQETIYINF